MKSFKRRLAAVLGATALLAACGGGEQIDPFDPARMLVFGDETSALRSDGTKYSVNATDTTTGAIACGSNPLWVQVLASQFGLVFKECNPNNLASPTALMYAASGAKVADVTAQIDRQLALDGFNDRDLVTVLVGANDVLELYAQFPTQSAAALGDAAEARGVALAAQVNRIANAGGKVIISTVQDMGVTPYALKQKAANADTDRAAVLTELSRRFNVGLRLNIINDGRMIGLILTDELLAAVSRYPSAYSVANAKDPSCAAASLPPVCTDKTLVTNATASGWMWAGDTLLGPGEQARIGSLARSRATNNPF